MLSDLVMKHSEIAARRLISQGISSTIKRSPAEVVDGLGAMQAQDYLGALWAIAVRTPGTTEAEVEKAIANREIVRTWPMRGTLHFIPAEDVRWMLELLTPRVIAGCKRRWEELELNEKVFTKARKIIERALVGGKHLSRPAVMELLDRGGIVSANQRGIHILSRLAMERVLCFGPRIGKQPSFLLLDEWIPTSRLLDREASLAAMARRYFHGHGPATLQDFVWWTGLKASDAKAGLANVAPELERISSDGVEYWMQPNIDTRGSKQPQLFLLPPFDEYLVGYRDRSAALEPHHANQVVPGGNGIFLPIVVQKGRVIGTWRRALQRNRVLVSASTFTPRSQLQKQAFVRAAKAYGQFLNLETEVEFHTPGPSSDSASSLRVASVE